MKFKCFPEPLFFNERTVLSYIPTTIESDVWFIPVVMLYGENKIGRGSFIQGSTFYKAFIEEDCAIENSEISNSSIKNNTHIGGASIMDSEIDEHVKIGPGVIIDEAIIGANARLPRSCHVAHCIIGPESLITSGACLNNYSSHGSELIDVGEKCFIGINVVINSSCLIGKEVYIGDGTVLSHGAHIPDHACVLGYGRDCYTKPDCSFYMGNGLWVVTKKPTDPKTMKEVNEELHLYDTTIAFHCRLKNDPSHEWLTSVHPHLNNFRPIDLLKEEARYESDTGAIALKKLIRQEIESLSLDSSSPPS
jgi:carbonic anhydrase/acetyltransferase-like protein (isoleucine patch superfamily)